MRKCGGPQRSEFEGKLMRACDRVANTIGIQSQIAHAVIGKGQYAAPESLVADERFCELLEQWW
jgi:hypothetical protein